MPTTTKKKSSARKRAKEKTPTFEQMMVRLEEIVGQLEEGELPLEGSIALFEEGMGLTRAGLSKLDDAERKVDLLLQANGEEDRVPFDLDGGGES